jgi:hypothetical protein
MCVDMCVLIAYQDVSVAEGLHIRLCVLILPYIYAICVCSYCYMCVHILLLYVS